MNAAENMTAICPAVTKTRNPNGIAILIDTGKILRYDQSPAIQLAAITTVPLHRYLRHLSRITERADSFKMADGARPSCCHRRGQRCQEIRLHHSPRHRPCSPSKFPCLVLSTHLQQPLRQNPLRRRLVQKKLRPILEGPIL